MRFDDLMETVDKVILPVTLAERPYTEDPLQEIRHLNEDYAKLLKLRKRWVLKRRERPRSCHLQIARRCSDHPDLSPVGYALCRRALWGWQKRTPDHSLSPESLCWRSAENGLRYGSSSGQFPCSYLDYNFFFPCLSKDLFYGCTDLISGNKESQHGFRHGQWQ